MTPPVPPPPNEKKLRVLSFAMHATRGLLRDQTARRKTMCGLVLLAVVMLFCGATVLARWLDPETRPVWFILYWLACTWVTVTVVLLACLDLIRVRADARAEQRALAEKIAASLERKDAD